MSKADATSEVAIATVLALKPALASIEAGREYMGGISRSKFYADILPLLETVKFGNRNMIVVASMDRVIASRSRSLQKTGHDDTPDLSGGSPDPGGASFDVTETATNPHLTARADGRGGR
jgi:hypothetical protein